MHTFISKFKQNTIKGKLTLSHISQFPALKSKKAVSYGTDQKHDCRRPEDEKCAGVGVRRVGRNLFCMNTHTQTPNCVAYPSKETPSNNVVIKQFLRVILSGLPD
ncbi:unnamed protein product [Rotaria magnacalcarata]